MEFHRAANLLPMMSEEEFSDLLTDISEHGHREPIYTHEGKIIDGRNRYKACLKAGIEPKFRVWDGEGSLVAFVISLNIKRRHLNPSQHATLAVEAIPLLAEEAAKRQKEGRARGGRTAGRGRRKNNSSPQKVGGSNHEGEAAAQAAKIAHTNRQYVADAAKLMKEDPEEFQRVKAGEITLPDVRRRMKEARKAAVVVKIRNEPRALPTGPFRVIVIDPPWRYEARAEDVTHRARSPYPDMSLEEIQALPVAELAHDDCILWLWTTNAFVFETPALLRAWGFEYKTKLTWFKDRIGTGNWLRGQTEDCLLAVRGKPVVTLTNQSTSLAAPAGEHSRKPDKFYAMVESLCPGNKLEMFARQPREGWQSWGAELADGDALEQKGA